MKLACKYPSRLAALEEANKGPANFFDHAAIVPYSPQDAPEASGQPQGSPEGQESPLDRQNAGN